MSGACRSIQEQLDTYARGGLPLADREAVQRHLRHCAACRQSLTLEQLLLAARLTPAPPAPAGLADEVARAWTEQRSQERLWRSLRAGRRAAVRLAFCSLVDPYLQVDYQVRGALVQVRDQALAPLHLIGALLEALLEAQLALAGRLVTAPLQHAGALLCRLASGAAH